jgi:hypothetical protein
MSTQVMWRMPVVSGVFVHRYPSRDERSNVQVLVRGMAGDHSKTYRLINVLIQTIGAADPFVLGEHVELVDVESLTTEIDGRSFNWLRAADLRARYCNEGC